MVNPIADTIIRIKNALAVSHMTVVIPFSKFKHQLAKVLEEEGYIKKVEKKGKGINKVIEIAFKKKEDELGPEVFELKLISKPGQRIYAKAKDIKSVGRGYGMEIISTSRGLMTGKEAKKKSLGGEIICKIL